MTVRSSVLEVKDKSLRFSHAMLKDRAGELAATTTLTAVHLDTLARRACAFPPQVAERAKEMTD